MVKSLFVSGFGNSPAFSEPIREYWSYRMSTDSLTIDISSLVVPINYNNITLSKCQVRKQGWRPAYVKPYLFYISFNGLQ